MSKGMCERWRVLSERMWSRYNTIRTYANVYIVYCMYTHATGEKKFIMYNSCKVFAKNRFLNFAHF